MSVFLSWKDYILFWDSVPLTTFMLIYSHFKKVIVVQLQLS